MKIKAKKHLFPLLFSTFLLKEKLQKKHGLKYFAINSAPFHCSGITRYAQTVSLTAIPFRRIYFTQNI
jgi:hypothetical protein